MLHSDCCELLLFVSRHSLWNGNIKQHSFKVIFFEMLVYIFTILVYVFVLLSTRRFISEQTNVIWIHSYGLSRLQFTVQRDGCKKQNLFKLFLQVQSHIYSISSLCNILIQTPEIYQTVIYTNNHDFDKFWLKKRYFGWSWSCLCTVSDVEVTF